MSFGWWCQAPVNRCGRKHSEERNEGERPTTTVLWYTSCNTSTDSTHRGSTSRQGIE